MIFAIYQEPPLGQLKGSKKVNQDYSCWLLNKTKQLLSANPGFS